MTLHVVFGTGQVGASVATRLTEAGIPVRAVSRHRPATLTADWQAADVTDPEAAIEAAKGATVIYQCLNAPYTQWPQRFPPLQRAVLAAAKSTGALLVSLENVYAYGPTGGAPLTEDLPLAATTSKGRTRAAMTRELLDAGLPVAIGRAADFFGPGVRDSTLGERVFGNAVAGKKVDFIGNPALPHTYSYVPDVAAGLIELGRDERAIGQAWHLPSAKTVTTQEILDIVADQLGHPVAVRGVPKFVLRALGLVSPLIRALSEVEYQFNEPFVLDTSKYERTFGSAGTDLSTAVSETLEWYRRAT